MADGASPRRPTRSVRRPNGTPATQTPPGSLELPPPHHRQPSSTSRRSRGSPSPERNQSTWDEDKLERNRASEARVRTGTRTDEEIFKAAQVGQAFALGVKDRKANRDVKIQRTEQVEDVDPLEDEDVDDPTGEFARITGMQDFRSHRFVSLTTASVAMYFSRTKRRA